MPAIKYYEVKQTRIVQVAAHNEIGAAQIADAAFTNGQDSDGGVAKGWGPEGVYGNTISRIEVVDLAITKGI